MSLSPFGPSSDAPSPSPAFRTIREATQEADLASSCPAPDDWQIELEEDLQSCLQEIRAIESTLKELIEPDGTGTVSSADKGAFRSEYLSSCAPAKTGRDLTVPVESNWLETTGRETTLPTEDVETRPFVPSHPGDSLQSAAVLPEPWRDFPPTPPFESAGGLPKATHSSASRSSTPLPESPLISSPSKSSPPMDLPTGGEPATASSLADSEPDEDFEARLAKLKRLLAQKLIQTGRRDL